jgi:CheY-like chemotaxis protein
MAILLFVDDDPLALKLMQKTASFYGHQAVTAGSGQEALELAAVQQLDLVVVDMQMNDMDGLELIRRLLALEKEPRPPAVILTAGPADDISIRARAAGAAAVFYKPINFEEIDQFLQKQRIS